jgi:hypothetical protein
MISIDDKTPLNNQVINHSIEKCFMYYADKLRAPDTTNRRYLLNDGQDFFKVTLETIRCFTNTLFMIMENYSRIKRLNN